MQKVKAMLQVYFEDPFWVAVYSRDVNGRLEAAKVTFGPEPKDYEVYEYFHQNGYRLKLSPSVAGDSILERRVNPKRMQRKIRKLLSASQTSTKAQLALKLQQEEQQLQRKQAKRQRTKEAEQIRFQMKQQKKKEKHRGR